MNERAFRAMGTDWYVAADGAPPRVLAAVERIVRDEERRFSRFRPDSALSALNRDRVLREPVVAGVVREALRFHRRTRGAFDPAIGAALIAAGYDRSFESLTPCADADGDAAGSAPSSCATGDPRRPTIDVRRDTVRLRGEGFVDLSGIVKGWTVDRVAAHLRGAGATAAIVDGGGDIRVDGPCGAPGDGSARWPIGVGDGLVAWLAGGAVATSSTLHRRWAVPGAAPGGGWAHHIIAPDRGAPAIAAARTATVVAADATTADVLATTLLVDLERGLDAVAHAGAAALIQDAGGWRMTAEMDRYLG